MVEVFWDSKTREFLRKLPKEISKRIFNKFDKEISLNVERYLKALSNIDTNKIRVGDYRLFVDYDKAKNILFVRSIRHRKNAYK